MFMKKVLIALERESFNYLFKFNDCDISLKRIIDEDLNSIQRSPLIRTLAKKIEQALPYFESEDEVVLLEYLKENIQFGDGLRIVFDGVLGILPLSTFAKNSLESRLKNDFRIYGPIQEELLKDIHRIREDKKRFNSVNKLLGIYALQIESDFSKNLRSIVIKNEVGESLEGEGKKALINLIKFDLTPSFIPSGNVEGFLKLGCVFLLTIKEDINLLMNGPYYKIITKNRDLLNSKNLFESYVILQQLFENANNEDKVKLNTPEKTFNKEFNGFNAYLAYFIYLSLNRLLQSEDYNLLLIKEELEKLRKECPKELAHSLAIFGYVHSFDRIYESIHRLSNSPLFITSKTSLGNSELVAKGKNENKSWLNKSNPSVEDPKSTDSKPLASSLTKDEFDKENSSSIEKVEESNLTDLKQVKDSSPNQKNYQENDVADGKRKNSNDLRSTPKIPNSEDLLKGNSHSLNETQKKKTSGVNEDTKPYGTSEKLNLINDLKSNEDGEEKRKSKDLISSLPSKKEDPNKENENNASEDLKKSFIEPSKTKDGNVDFGGNSQENDKTSISKFYNELDSHKIFSIISKSRYKGVSKEKKEVLKALNSILKESDNDSFNFEQIKTYLLTIVKQDSSLKEFSDKIIDKLKEEFKY